MRQQIGSLDDLPGTDLEAGDGVAGPVVPRLRARPSRCLLRPARAAALRRPHDARRADASLAGVSPRRPPLCAERRRAPVRAPARADTDRTGRLGRRPVTSGRIPLDLYRGRVLYPPHVQAAEIAVRTSTGCDRGGRSAPARRRRRMRVTFATPAGELTTPVERRRRSGRLDQLRRRSRSRRRSGSRHD